MSITSKFLVFFFGLTYSSATLTVEVDLISYRNPNSEDCNGGNCDGVYYGTCDNVFHFCLRVVGSQSCLASLGTNYVQDDSMTFSSYDLSRLGISNPLVFSSISTSSLLELYVNITDYDSIGDNDTVDDITIPLSGQLEADSLFSLSKTYSGSCGRASLAVKFRLTSLCPTNQYGPQCDKECIEEPQQTLCNYLGESVDLCPNGDTTECRCEGHFLEPNCILCDEDYYLAGECDVFCSPSDSDYRGHYRCNPETGEKVCLEGYKDPSTSCVDEDENHDGGSGSTAGAASGSGIAGLVILGCCILCCCSLGGGSSNKNRHETSVVTTTRPTNLTSLPAVAQGTINPVVLDRKVFVLVTKE